nr:MAG TPA_asm: hypothetical protein [Caudoviricetes sp.]
MLILKKIANFAPDSVISGATLQRVYIAGIT